MHVTPLCAPRGRIAFGRSIVALTACLLWPLAASSAQAGLWFEDGRLRPEAKEAVAILADAGSEGLRPEDYAAAPLAHVVAHAEGLDASGRMRLDLALSQAMEGYLEDLHQGRVDPQTVDEHFPAPPGLPFGAEGYLREALDRHDLRDAVRDAEPMHPQYAKLRKLLAHYRELAAQPLWAKALPALPGRKLEVGAAWSGAELLARRLQAVGDMPADARAAPKGRYAGALVEAVKAFQLRHGLEPDGVIGRGTYAALQQGPSARVRQIELAMERLRWLPDFYSQQLIVVNVPEFALRTYRRDNDGPWQEQGRMKVVVGGAADGRHTPIFDEIMRYIEFSPYWNVPPSIVRKELIPHLRRDPAYFNQQGFEFVDGGGQVIRTLNAANLQALAQGRLRIRQRPGEHNPLGDIKFAFPNRDNIYLHHTAAPRLFARDRRDFSHGCVRVDDPVGLASFVLADRPDWNSERIRQTMDQGKSTFLRLDNDIPVLITYITAVVAEDGKAHFFADLYGHDDVLARALSARPPRLSFAG